MAAADPHRRVKTSYLSHIILNDIRKERQQEKIYAGEVHYLVVSVG